MPNHSKEISARSVPKARALYIAAQLEKVPPKEASVPDLAKIEAKAIAREAFKEHKKAGGGDYTRVRKGIRAAGRDAKMSA